MIYRLDIVHYRHTDHSIILMTLRQIIIPITVALLLGVSSCTVTQHSIRKIYLPGEMATTEPSPDINSELVALAQQLSTKLRMPVNAETDEIGLYAFAADWLGTPYRFGANSRRGTDCSGFAYMLYLGVYKTDIGRASSADLMSKTKHVRREDLQQGDLVFFNINNRRGGRASHVGVYLKDGKFIHASTRHGVIISSLSEGYYRRTYIGAGRVY